MKYLLALTLIYCFTQYTFSQKSEIDSLTNRLNKVQGEERANTLNNLSATFLKSDIVKSENYTREALTISNNLNYSEGKVKSYGNLGVIFQRRGDYTNARKYILKSALIAEQSKNKNLLVIAYDYMFTLYFIMGQYDSAAIYVKNYLKIAQEIGFTKYVAQGKSNIGILNGIQGKHIIAIEYFMEALKLYESLGKDVQVALQMGRLGHTFELAGNYGEALNYLKQAYEIQNKLNDKYSAGWTLLNIGVTYSRLSEDSLQLVYLNKSLDIAEESTDNRLILACLDNIGGWYSTHGDYIRSNEYLQKAYNLSEKTGYNSRTVYITGNLAENYLLTGELEKAQEFGEKHLEYAINDKEISEQKVAYYVLSQIYAAKKEFKKSHNALMEYITINDSIFNQEKSQQIEALRTTFETEKKEQEILLLAEQKQNAESRRNLYGILAVLVFIVGFLVFYQQRLRSKRDRQLLEKGQEVEKTKSRFFANITHEFRTPLTLILGPIELLKSIITSKEAIRQLEVMEKNSNRLLELINQLLDLSKIESKKMMLQPEQVDIAMLTKKMAGLFDSLTNKKEITLKINNQLKNSQAYLDIDKIEKVYVNLISNAIKYTPKGGNISISLTEMQNFEKTQTRFIEIKIKDSGRGIPAKDIEYVFDQYFQSDKTLNSEYTGSGIGLALTKELVELHGGTISVSSEECKGSEFTLTFPADLIPTKSISKFRKRKYKEQHKKVHSSILALNTSEVLYESGTDGQKPILLIVEDNADVREYIKNIVESKYRVELAKNGKLGLEMALQLIPDLVISDVMMPKMNGYELCEKLKSNEKTSHIPVIMLTARASIEDKIEGLEHKADDYLAKPFVPKELHIRIANLIESRIKLREKFSRELVFKPGEVGVSSVDDKFLEKLKTEVERNLENEELGVDDIAELMNMSRSQLHRKVKALTNLAPNDFLKNYRLVRAMELIKGNAGTTAEIAFNVGFRSPSYFTRCFREHFGFPPVEVRKTVY